MSSIIRQYNWKERMECVRLHIWDVNKLTCWRILSGDIFRFGVVQHFHLGLQNDRDDHVTTSWFW